jgi:hypothetical protein
MVMSMLPFPVTAAAGEIGMAALEGQMSPELRMAAKVLGYASLAAVAATVGKIGFHAAKAAVYYVQKYGMRGVASNLWNGGVGLANRAIQRIRKGGNRCACFAAGTLVWTATSGLIPIEEVRPGFDQAITLNEITGEVEIHPITDLIVNEQTSLLRVTIIHETGRREVIDTTDEHPFHEESRVGGWTRADSLSPGDLVRTMSGSAVVDSLSFGNQRVTVYNLTVADAHTFLVGDEAAWVHNCMKADFAPDFSYVNKQGQTAHEHISLHGVNNPGRDKPHGVFDDDAVLTAMEAWSKARQVELVGIPQAHGTYAFNIHMGRRVGWEGGAPGTGKALNNVRIIMNSQGQILTAFPF